MIKRKTKEGNAKVKNATRVEIEGIKFRSKLEAFCYRKCIESSLNAQYEPNKYILMDKFEYNGEKVRAMTFTPDFVGEGWIIECKGMITDGFTLKWKLFKNHLRLNNLKYDLYMPRNQKEVLAAINTIKSKLNEIRE